MCVSVQCFLNQELLKPAAQTWSEDTCSQNVKLDDDDEDENGEGTTAALWDTQHSDADVEVCY